DENTRSYGGDEPTRYELFLDDRSPRANYPGVLDNLESLEYVPEYTRDYPVSECEHKDRNAFVSGPVCNEDGSKAILDIQANDYKDRWILLLDPESGKVEQLDRQHDPAWVAGPGIGGFRGGSLGWMPNGREIWFQSEK